MEPRECQFCSDELSRCDCEFELAIEGLASVYGCGCDGLCLTMDQVGAHNELSPSLIQLTMDPAAVEEEGETEGAAVEEEAPAAAPPRPKKKGVSKKSKQIVEDILHGRRSPL